MVQISSKRHHSELCNEDRKLRFLWLQAFRWAFPTTTKRIKLYANLGLNIMNIKSNKIVLAVIAVLSFVFAYQYDKWKYNAMWERCQASDMADSEAYAFVNHHSSLDFMLEGKSRACSMQ